MTSLSGPVRDAGALSPEERCERVRMALAEVGWPDVFVFHDPKDDLVHALIFECPAGEWWRAATLAGEQSRCWPCFEADPTLGGLKRQDPCTHDPYSSPWPPLPDGPEERTA